MYCYSCKFTRLGQIFRGSNTLGFGYSSRKGAKTLSWQELNNNPQSKSLSLIRPLRLGVLARDNPNLTGARSAPYENLRVLRDLRGEQSVFPWRPLRALREIFRISLAALPR